MKVEPIVGVMPSSPRPFTTRWLCSSSARVHPVYSCSKIQNQTVLLHMGGGRRSFFDARYSYNRFTRFRPHFLGATFPPSPQLNVPPEQFQPNDTPPPTLP
ncbi:unnamed protein product [Ectocarpus sp. 12 AP-2014]